ncbi:bifunctional tetrahydrofolate synthase/dihydrofolate synthase [Rheinheimera riviphila]|uniref:Dihydrofolate synthase/folylpolyglutamate synthase n=1 Tax=Rheinheimera riviphila TaxID=1834037 RepID=A0A437R184_9GAMM|nr:bifunctional tetrahydrofolate synthase/dihydrofolate synthase [Rheinheimera riviphila]RVU40539.1 bifunctional tetrahydrofolate synthase/dihydrofolate synthase [Rheinheimera riviphila]
MNSSALTTSQSCQTLTDWLAFIEQSRPIDQIELGLTRVQTVAARGALQQLPGIKILLAGTNGKGSSARCLEQLLLAQGYSVGVYTSPHLLQFNERLRLNGVDAADALWVAGLREVDQLRAEVPLTYFEFTTLAAFAMLKQQQPDVCIIEVGLGGRLDATNIIEPDACVITTIDLDHQDWLGNDRESIGREKAGIFRQERLAIVGDLDVPQSILAEAVRLSVPLRLVNRDYQYQLAEDGLSWQWQGKSTRLTDLPLVKLPLQNIATCLACLEALQLLPPPAKIATVLAELTLAGRMQWLQQQPAILLDVAHNPQSAAYLASQLALLAPRYQRIHVLVGMLKDKDMRQSLADFAGLVSTWHCAGLPPPRGATGELLAAQLPDGANVVCYPDVATAWATLSTDLHDTDLVLIFGSFVTVSQFLAHWQQGNV